MRIAWDDRFDREKALFALVHCCEDCGQFDHLGARCRHEFPTMEHREADYRERRADLLFCKEFELC